MKNNSSEMKTQVTTYVIEETQELIYDNVQLDKWNNLIRECGLKGQEEIRKPDKSPIPFMVLNNTQRNILDCLCPQREDVENYNLTPIPVEILSLISLAKKENYFSRLQIWYDEKKKDPACVGVTGYWTGDDAEGHTLYDKNNDRMRFASKQELTDYQLSIGAKGKWQSFNEAAHYILGRWSDVKESFEQLAIRAKKRFIGEKKNDYEKSIVDYQRKLEDLNHDAYERFGI